MPISSQWFVTGVVAKSFSALPPPSPSPRPLNALADSPATSPLLLPRPEVGIIRSLVISSRYLPVANSADLTTGFTHRVVGTQNVEVVPAQASTTLSVPNGAGAVKHQLWYKECLVKETAFTACAAAAAPTASTPTQSTAPVAKTPSKSDASSLGFAALSLVGAIALL